MFNVLTLKHTQKDRQPQAASTGELEEQVNWTMARGKEWLSERIGEKNIKGKTWRMGRMKINIGGSVGVILQRNALKICPEKQSRWKSFLLH